MIVDVYDSMTVLDNMFREVFEFNIFALQVSTICWQQFTISTAVFEINRSLNTMAARFATPEVSSTTHVSTGVENFTSVHNIVDMKEFNNIYKVDVLQQTMSTDEAFKQIEKRAEDGSQHIFVWLTQENYNKVINGGNMVMIPGD